MINKSRFLSIICVLCMLVNIFAVSSYDAEAFSDGSRIVSIKNMWNRSYMVNDQGVGKYSFGDLNSSGVWVITPYDDSTYTIKNWDDTYLRASGDSVISATMYNPSDATYRWNIRSTGYGQYWITSAADSNKAINIENLTGSLQLTNYYETWESAKWIINDTDAPELELDTDNVIFTSASNGMFLNNGPVISNMNTMQASIIYKNYLYRVIDKGSYCYIQYNPGTGTGGYMKAGSTYYSFYNTLDENSVEFRWNIQRNADGTVSMVSVAYPGMAVSSVSGSSLVNLETAGADAKWNMNSGNSLMIRIFNSMDTHTLIVGGNNSEQAIFEYNGESKPAGLDAQWQVIYSDGKMYLRNGLTGKYLCSSGIEGDTKAYVKAYDSSKDDLFVWEANNMKYSLGLAMGYKYICPDYNGLSADETEDVDAVILSNNGTGRINLNYQAVGFAQ